MRYFDFAILGLGTGAVIAAIALGLVVAYRASGVVNFAHGAMAAFTAYTYTSLREAGEIPVPPLPNPVAPIEAAFDVELFDLPTFIGPGSPMATLPAMAVALLVAALLGMAAHYLVFSPLRYAPTLAKVVASVGIMILLQGAIVIRYGSRPREADRVLPDHTVEWFGTTLPIDRYLILLLVAALATGLWLFFRLSRFGIATRAAAENERSATLLGINVDGQAMVSWMLASVLAGLAGIVASPIVGLTPNQLTLLVIPALGAALLGRMSSVVIAAAGGLVIGALQSVVFLLEQSADWVPEIGLSQALPLLVIALAMVVRGEILPSRGSVAALRLPDAYASKLSRGRIAAHGGLVAFSLWIVLFAQFPVRNGMNNTMIGVVLALSLVVVTGYVAQISLMQMAVAGIGAYGVATFSTDAGLPTLLALLLAVLCAATIGVVMSLPALRTRGSSLAIITIASGLAIQEFVLEREGWFGSADTRDVELPGILGFELGPTSSFPIGDGKIPSPGFGLLVLALTVVTALGVMRLRRSRLGEQMLAVRSNERAAAAAGVNVAAIKVTAFSISSALAGLAGALTAFKLGQFSADSFDVFASLAILAFAYLGGITTVAGAVMAGTLFPEGIGVVVTEELLNNSMEQYTGFVAGFLLILTAVYHSEGIDGFQREQFHRLRARLGWARDEQELDMADVGA